MPQYFVSPWLVLTTSLLLLITPTCCGVKSRKLSIAAETPKSSATPPHLEWIYWLFPVIGVGIFAYYIYVVGKKAAKVARDREMLRALSDSPIKLATPPPTKQRQSGPAQGPWSLQQPMMNMIDHQVTTTAKQEESDRVELVFFVDEDEAFQLDDLFGAEADLQKQTICSSLYKVTLKNNVVYVVKRLKKVQVSFDVFGQAIRQIGNIKHPNILPLVAYSSTQDEKLMIYQYQPNGSLLNLLDDYIEGKKEFPWRWRLVIAGGIARGLDMIHQTNNVHGNLKPSNILLDDNNEAVISEYGLARFMDPQKCCLQAANGYTAPERTGLSESSDVYSFGVILLELLTGKTIEKTGMDLPKWVKSMVSEEWTGEVFDKEVSRGGKMWGFSLLKVGLLCVSDDPDKRPSIAEVLEKIEQVMNAHQVDIEKEKGQFNTTSYSPAPSPITMPSSCHQDSCLLHTTIPETWDTPGSNN